MPLSLNDLSTSCNNVLQQVNNIPANLFLENKQEDFLTTLITVDLTKRLGAASNYFITQYTGNGIKRADIAELDSRSLVSHIECKYLYSNDFMQPIRAKMNWAERELVSALNKIGKTNNDYILCYCIHINNINTILANIKNSYFQYGQNIFTYIHNHRITSNTLNAMFKRTNISIFNPPSGTTIEQNIQTEIGQIIHAMSSSTVRSTVTSSNFRATLPSSQIQIDFKLILYAIRVY